MIKARIRYCPGSYHVFLYLDIGEDKYMIDLAKRNKIVKRVKNVNALILRIPLFGINDKYKIDSEKETYPRNSRFYDIQKLDWKTLVQKLNNLIDLTIYGKHELTKELIYKIKKHEKNI